MGISIRPEEIEKRLSRIFADPMVYEAIGWMVDGQLDGYVEKLVAPVTTNFPEAQAKYLRINGAIEAIRSLRQRIEWYKNNADKETLLDQT